MATIGLPTRQAVRDPAAFHRVVSACPMQVHWLEEEPITDVLSMGAFWTATGGSWWMGSPLSPASPRSATHGPAPILRRDEWAARAAPHALAAPRIG
jgi:hypothetical protein